MWSDYWGCNRELLSGVTATTETDEKRSAIMSSVRGGDTRPELILRCGLHRMGFRFKLNNKHLPGRPDLVFPKYGAAVFVHGCFWHRHEGCRKASTPKTNVDFWKRKFSENVTRDRRVERELMERGWRVMVVWECELLSNPEKVLLDVSRFLTGMDSPKAPLPDCSRLLKDVKRKIRRRIDSYGAK